MRSLLGRAPAVAVLILSFVSLSAIARGDEGEVRRSRTWPYQLDLSVVVGGEPHDRGTPIAFGVGAEVIFKLRAGVFAALLSSEGTPILPVQQDGKTQPSLADRISVPFGIAARPLSGLGARDSYWHRLLAGVGVQVGATVEHLRTSDDNRTVGGLHLAANLDIPVWGGPAEGGVALRLYGRLLIAPEIQLETNNAVFEPITSGQIYGGLVYYP
jgi:hypothetical protein